MTPDQEWSLRRAAILGLVAFMLALVAIILGDAISQSNRRDATIQTCELRAEIGRLNDYCVEKLIQHNRVDKAILERALQGQAP